MKEELIINKSCSGFSTLEMLIAMAILIMVISAVILVSFGSQSMLIDSQTNSEALNKAQELLEEVQALARKDYKLVNPVATITDGIYQKKIDVETQPDFFTKKVTATVSWLGEHNRNLNVQLSALVTNFNNAVGGDTCDSVLRDNTGATNADVWKTPQVKNSITDFAQLAGVSGIYPITDIDAYKGKLYITTNNSSENQSTFFVFDITDPTNPVLDHGGTDKIDNDSDNNSGLNAVAVAENASGNGKIYAFVANASGVSVGQLQIIEVSVSPPQVVATYPMPGVTSTSSSQGVGNSIFYKDGFVYLGLKATGPGNGPEFHIIDMHDFLANPTNPNLIHYADSYSIGDDINAIYVKGNYAYLATSDSQELIVLNVSNPTDISTGSPVWGYDAAGGGNGKSLYLVGDTLSLGRTFPSSGPEFYILNNTDPTNIPVNNPDPPSPYPYTQSIGSSVDGLVVRAGLDTVVPSTLHNLAFFLTSSNFQLWDITNLSAITQWSPTFLNLPGSGSSSFEPVLDCEGNIFFVGSNNSEDHGYLSVIAP
ncbi:MAG: hypothetical protein NT012_03275 [Candidatus Nealsonbacteria bacterium]|nr:hypothetical protein [Candidatus Nealsonbacteria bacterium]